ncbi:trypco2 family protein [Micromonospora humidisoli]|uniref:Trypsin-co-occurring domain-containing protein n=1 Tax=Micromonospora humidisoli TaxID=2807622 RepID=A0ABS2JL92_9ACTN|nr:trypco2 family protein [Micromonospora humidisoli]MBM7086644.1 hypothetical protein [Micromonospora humidisoli]
MQPDVPTHDLTIPEAVHSLRQQILQAVEWADDEDLTFSVNSIEVELQLTVTRTLKGKAEAGLWKVVTVGGGVDHARAATHRVLLNLKPQYRDGRRVAINDQDD